MTEILRHGATCQIKQAGSGKLIEAAVHDFKDRDRLTVVVNQSVKLFLKWNGKVYEGKMAGLDFVSDGPKVQKTQTSIRG
jgi:hypothetical protein